MARARYLVTGFLILLLAPGGPARADTHIALVLGGSGPAGRSALDLATAKLSTVPGVALLERTRIDRVLAEQKLTLAGFADAGQAITVGKLLSADILALVEVEAGGKAALGLVVFDAKTGLRLWDAALPAGGPAQEADGITEGLKAALKKLTGGREALHTVGFVAARNADLPRAMDSYCDSLAQLVERRLAAAPDVAVLERQRLEAVTGERALPTGAAEKQLLAALVQLELEIRRGPRGEGLQATVHLTDGKGKNLGKVAVSVKELDRAGGADTLAQAICKALKATPAAGKGDTVREGSRFQREATQLWSFKQTVRALRAAESAYALDPADPAKRALLAQYLIGHGGDLLDPARPAVRPVVTGKPEAVAAAVGLVRRGIDLRALALSRLPQKNVRTLFAHIRLHFRSDDELTLALQKFAALDLRQLDGESKDQVAAVGAAAEQWLCAEYLETLASAAEREPVLFETYTITLFGRANQLRLAAPDAQHFTRKFIAVVDRWLVVTRKLSPEQMGMTAPVRLWPLLTLTTERQRVRVRWSPGPRELELYDGLFARMETHTHPLLRMQGRCGRVWVALLTKRFTPEQSYQGFVKAKREALQAIKDARSPSPAVARGYLLLMGDLCTFDAVGFKEVGKRSQEHHDLWEEMLAQNLIMENVLLGAASQPLDASVKPARRLAVLDRTVELLDNPRLVYLGVNRAGMKGNMLLGRARLLRDNPELAGKQAATPWALVRTVLDVTELPGIRELKMPTVVGGDLYVVGLGGAPTKGFLQPFRVSLQGGKAQPLAKMPITWVPAPRTHSASPIPANITGVQLGAGRLYVSTRMQGFYAFPLDGGPAVRLFEDKGLPSEGAESMVLHGGRLYAALHGGYLVSLDPQTGKFDVLASSRRRDKGSPFDDGEVFTIPYLAADAERHRLVFLLQQGKTRPGGTSGLWAWDLKTSQFKRLLETGGVNWYLMGRPIRDGRLLIFSTITAVDFDLQRDKHVLLWSGLGGEHGPALDPATALSRESVRAFPAIFRDGWIWSESPFGRFSVAGKKQELFPLPPRKSNLPVLQTNVLQLVGRDQVLFGSSSVLWLLALRKE